MRRALVVGLLFVLSACGTTRNANVLPPEVAIRQTFGPADQGATEGPIRVEFELAIANQSSEELRLKRIEIESLGTGAYVLRRETIYLNEVVEPVGQKAVRFWARGFARAGTYRAGIGEPVTVRAIAHFETDMGPLRKIIMKNIPQGSRSSEE
jgi:hypothetical protein